MHRAGCWIGLLLQLSRYCIKSCCTLMVECYRRFGGIAMNRVTKFFRKFTNSFGGAKTCSTRMMGNQAFECTVRKPSPEYCEHSLSMGSSFICKHPERLEFVDK
jgi:hypothetical protein